MAPINPNFTARLWVDYHTTNAAHTWMVRYDQELVDATGAADLFATFLAAIEPLLTTLTIDGMRFTVASEDISIPLPWPGDATYGSGSEDLSVVPFEMRFMGRGGDGRRVHWSVYGTNVTLPDNYRIAAGAQADVAAGIAAIEAAISGGAFLTITGNPPVLYQYVDVNFNSYWERQRRKGL